MSDPGADAVPVRLATAEDAPAVAACVAAAYAKYVPRIGREPAPMTADYPALIARGLVHVLPAPNGLHGVAVIEPKRDHLFLENIAVWPAGQGHGHGRRLMAFVEAQARAHGLPEIRLYTHEKMTENVAYYTRLGFEETERRVEDGFARVFMRQRLG